MRSAVFMILTTAMSALAADETPPGFLRNGDIWVFHGDSITHGVGESRLAHIPPFMPPWAELFVNRLKAIYKDEGIRLYNSAQSGAKSEWGAKMAGRMVASLNPDLVIIAFGQNDFWNQPANDFGHNISAIMETVRTGNPAAEFLLVATMRFDPAYSSKPEYWELVGAVYDLFCSCGFVQGYGQLVPQSFASHLEDVVD